MTSKPSEPPSHPSDPEHSTTSWTIPEPADVINYPYLWARKSAEGQEEGLKDRPLYGAIPAKLFDQVKRQISENHQSRQTSVVKRTEESK